MKLPFTIEKRDKPEPVTPRYPWLVPLAIGIAVAVLVGIVVYALLNDLPLA